MTLGPTLLDPREAVPPTRGGAHYLISAHRAYDVLPVIMKANTSICILQSVLVWSP